MGSVPFIAASPGGPDLIIVLGQPRQLLQGLVQLLRLSGGDLVVFAQAADVRPQPIDLGFAGDFGADFDSYAMVVGHFVSGDKKPAGTTDWVVSWFCFGEVAQLSPVFHAIP